MSKAKYLHKIQYPNPGTQAHSEVVKYHNRCSKLLLKENMNYCLLCCSSAMQLCSLGYLFFDKARYFLEQC